MLRLALEGQGHTVVEARDEPEAVAALRDTQPSIVLSDLRLPKGDGFGVLRAAVRDVQAAAPGVEVLVLRAPGVTLATVRPLLSEKKAKIQAKTEATP